MAFKQIDLSWAATSWLHPGRKAPRIDDFSDLEPDLGEDTRRGRRLAVRVSGVLCIAGLCGLAGWMTMSTPARGPIAAWGTMGFVTQPRLTMATLRLDEGAHRSARAEEAAAETRPSVGAAATEAPVRAAPVEPQALATAAEPQVRAAKDLLPLAAVRAPARQSRDPVDDPYAGPVKRLQTPASATAPVVELSPRRPQEPTLYQPVDL